MKKIIILLLLMKFADILIINAQNLNNYLPPKYRVSNVLKPSARLSTDQIDIESKQLLLNLFPSLKINQHDLVLLNKQQSLYGYHLLFSHLHQGKIVYESTVKINVANNGSVISVINDLILFEGMASRHPDNLKNNLMKPVYAMGTAQIEPLYVIKQQNKLGVYEELLTNAKGEVLSSKILDLFYSGKDTIVQTKVFNPDPLTSAQKAYGDDGGVWVNKNGSDYLELNAQRKQVSVTLEYNNDTFYTANPYAVILDMESPYQPPYKSPVNNFDFKRSDPAFREMMSLYHISHYRKYLKSIDLPFDSMFRMQVDIAAYQGLDQSRFSSQSGNPGLFFGIGGVPDAEDADVIIHEYTHGISFFIAPNTTTGNERLAVEEANCDFMACQYSKAISDFKWREVFNWDGHNEYWPGRNANSPNRYPKDLNSDFYVSSVIWSSMLNDMSIDMGRDIVTKLVFQSIYNYTENITMQQAAEMLVATDSLLYGKMHFGPLKYRLVERGFDISTGISEANELENNVVILNSTGFADGSGDLKLLTHLKDGVTFELIDMRGKIVFKQETSETSASISPYVIPAGMYILKISSVNQNFVRKLVRLN